MAKIEFNLEFNKKISNQLAFSVILILSLLVAWFSIYTGEKVIKTAKDSSSFNVQKRIDNANFNESKPNAAKIKENDRK